MDEEESSSRSVTMPTGNARTIVGLLAVAMVFSIISAEIGADNSTSKSKAQSAFSEPFLIIAGGTIAAAILSLIADTGETGRQFGIGLAGLATVTAVLVNGGPVWTALQKLLGSTATTPTSIADLTAANTAQQTDTPSAQPTMQGVGPSGIITTTPTGAI
jgi:hypothetical protein